jgi:hypothetical protein
LLRLLPAKQSTQQPAQTISPNILLLLLLAQIAHNDRAEEHHYLSDLAKAQTGLPAYVLHNLAL